MYIPSIYKNDNINEIISFIKENGFAQLVTCQDGVPLVSHLPVMYMEVDGQHYLHGHMARANTQWKSFGENSLIVFNGPHNYISSSWYDHMNVPTWNYIAVHVYGSMRVIDGDDLYESLKQLTDFYEANQVKPVQVDDMQDYVRMQMKGVVGFEMKIERFEGKWKLSQNRDEKNYKEVITQLEKLANENSSAIAAEMKKRANKLF